MKQKQKINQENAFQTIKTETADQIMIFAPGYININTTPSATKKLDCLQRAVLAFDAGGAAAGFTVHPIPSLRLVKLLEEQEIQRQSVSLRLISLRTHL